MLLVRNAKGSVTSARSLASSGRSSLIIAPGAAPHAAAGSRWLPISYVLYVYWPSGLVAWLRSAPQTVTSRGRAGRPAPLTDSSCLLLRRAQALAAGQPQAACCQCSAACRVRSCVAAVLIVG